MRFRSPPRKNVLKTCLNSVRQSQLSSALRWNFDFHCVPEGTTRLFKWRGSISGVFSGWMANSLQKLTKPVCRQWRACVSLRRALLSSWAKRKIACFCLKCAHLRLGRCNPTSGFESVASERVLALRSGALSCRVLFSPQPQQNNAKIDGTSWSSQRGKSLKMCSAKKRSPAGNCFHYFECFRVESMLAEGSAVWKVRPGWHWRTSLST